MPPMNDLFDCFPVFLRQANKLEVELVSQSPSPLFSELFFPHSSWVFFLLLIFSSLCDPQIGECSRAQALTSSVSCHPQWCFSDCHVPSPPLGVLLKSRSGPKALSFQGAHSGQQGPGQPYLVQSRDFLTPWCQVPGSVSSMDPSPELQTHVSSRLPASSIWISKEISNLVF